jgi:chromosome condensin MukBEF ATPase and DNA-binding subunit MukB
MAQSSPGRWRRAMDRVRRDRHANPLTDSTDGYGELELEAMLLREENARLKSTYHRPMDVGTLIEHLRLLAEPESHVRSVDDAWKALSDCFMQREALRQAGAELDRAIAALESRVTVIGDDSASLEQLTASECQAA